MKFGKWFWASFILTVVLGIAIQQHYMAPKVPIIIQLPVPPDAPGPSPKPEPCHSMSKCN